MYVCYRRGGRGATPGILIPNGRGSRDDIHGMLLPFYRRCRFQAISDVDETIYPAYDSSDAVVFP
jgi:hypothetical protein